MRGVGAPTEGMPTAAGKRPRKGRHLGAQRKKVVAAKVKARRAKVARDTDIKEKEVGAREADTTITDLQARALEKSSII